MPEPLDPSRTVTKPTPPDDGPAPVGSASRKDHQTSAARFGPPAKPGEVGTLGRYRLIERLGMDEGAMGEVYLALDTQLRRKLALKLMRPDIAVDVNAKKRFLREGRAAAQITHDNVVTVYEADERDGVPFIAMQLLHGQSLDAFLKSGREADVRQILRIAREAAAGLRAAHAIGLVHRDIKPANLWLESPTGRVKVLDFGLAKRIDTDADLAHSGSSRGTNPEITHSGGVVGTPKYMSLEQARGQNVDSRTDLFSLGAVIYQLCGRKPPFDRPSVREILIALAEDEPKPIRELNPAVPEPLAKLIHRLLAKKPEDRLESADELIHEIDAIVEQLDWLTPLGEPDRDSPQSTEEEDLWRWLDRTGGSSTPAVRPPVPTLKPVPKPLPAETRVESATQPPPASEPEKEPEPISPAYAGLPGNQFYITYCGVADSVLGNPGYTLRAASVADMATISTASRYPPYELPLDLWRESPEATNAPRRLARTADPDKGVWVAHSAYLPKDSVGRDRSYFTHLLFAPSVDPAMVLRSWGARGWVTAYPMGATKALPNNARLPVGSLVSDAALTAFLGDRPAGPTELSVTVCPARLRGSTAERRDLFARMLQAMLLLASEETESRRRLYIHAEPGVIALLLYGAIRLLPSAVTDGLTFSTFEPFHLNFRDYKLAEVVGTYLGSADRGLDSDLGTTRGIALDTFHPARSSPELRAPMATSLPEGVRDLLELAARGEWNVLPVVQHAVGADPEGLPRTGKALAVARGLTRVDEELADLDALIALQGEPIAADALLQQPRADKVWKVVEKNLSRPDVRKTFSQLLSQPDRVKELWAEGIDAILKEDFRKWDLYWTVLREAIGPDESRKLLNKLVGSEKNEGRLGKIPTDVRARLRAACGDVGLLPPRPLLVPIGLGELESLLGAAPEWAGYTAFVMMGKDDLGWLAHIPASARAQMRKRAREYLYTAPAAALAAYVQAARAYLDVNSDFLDVLFKPYSPSATKLMDKLLSVNTLEPSDWLKLCKSVQLTQDQWGEYLLEKDRLANFLFRLRGDEVGKEIWDVYLSLLSRALISPDLIESDPDVESQVIHEWERKVHNHLRTAAERLTNIGMRLASALPDGGVSRLFAANNLVKWVDDPSSAERDGWEEVKHACDIFGVDPAELVRLAYRKGGFDLYDPEMEEESLAPIISLFRTCFPVDTNFNTASRVVRELIRLSHDCPEQTRGAFQALILQSCVPEMHCRALLDMTWADPLEPEAIARVKEWIMRESTSTPSESVSQQGKRGRKGKYGARRWRRQDDGFWMLLTIVLALTAIIVCIAIVTGRLDNRNEAPTTQPDTPKIEKGVK